MTLYHRAMTAAVGAERRRSAAPPTERRQGPAAAPGSPTWPALARHGAVLPCSSSCRCSARSCSASSGGTGSARRTGRAGRTGPSSSRDPLARTGADRHGQGGGAKLRGADADLAWRSACSPRAGSATGRCTRPLRAAAAAVHRGHRADVGSPARPELRRAHRPVQVPGTCGFLQQNWLGTPT